MFQRFVVDIPSNLSNARPPKCSLKKALAVKFVCNVSWEIFDVVTLSEFSRWRLRDSFQSLRNVLSPKLSSSSRYTGFSTRPTGETAPRIYFTAKIPFKEFCLLEIILVV